MTKVINTYRALKDLKMGPENSRAYGDLVPEAADWPNLGVWVREGYVEPYTCSAEEMAAHEKKFGSAKTVAKKKVTVKKSAVAPAKKRVVRKVKRNGRRELSEQSV
jgi:hypothetical protein